MVILLPVRSDKVRQTGHGTNTAHSARIAICESTTEHARSDEEDRDKGAQEGGRCG